MYVFVDLSGFRVGGNEVSLPNYLYRVNSLLMIRLRRLKEKISKMCFMLYKLYKSG